MAKDYNINITSKSEESKKSRPSSVGSANLKKLEKIDTIIEKALSSSMDKLAKEFTKAFAKEGAAIERAVKKAGTGEKVYSPQNLAKVLTNTQQSLLKEVRKSLKDVVQPGAKQKDVKLDTKKLEQVISSKLDALTRSIKSTTGADIKIDTSDLKSELTKAVKGLESKELINVVKKLSSEITNLKTSLKGFNQALGSLKDLRKGGLEGKEIVKAINSLKEIIKQGQKVKESVKVTREAVKGSTLNEALSKDIKSLRTTLTALVTQLKESTTRQAKGIAKEKIIIEPILKDLGIDEASLIKNIEKVAKTVKAKLKVKVEFEPDTSKVEAAEKEIKQDVVKPVKFDLESKSLLDLHKELSKLKSQPATVGVNTEELNKALDLINDIHRSFIMGKSSVGKWSSSMQSGKVKDELQAILKELDKVVDKSAQLHFRELGKTKQITKHIEKSAPIGTIKGELTKVSKTKFFKDKTTNGDSNKARQHFRQVFVQLGELQKQLANIENLSFDKLAKVVDKAGDEVAKSTGDFTSEVKRAANTFRDVSTKLKGFKGPEQIGAVRSTVKSIPFPSGVIKAGMKPLDIGESGLRKRVSVDAANLAKSLEKAQKEIFKTLQEGLAKTAQKGFGVVGETPKEAFQLRGRQFGLDIANIKKLSGLTGMKGTAQELLKEYKKVLSKELFTGKLEKGYMSSEVAKWIKQTGLSNMSKEVQDALGKSLGDIKEIKRGAFNKEISEIQKDVENAITDNLQAVFAATAGSSQIREALKERGLVKTISLPAAKVTPTGNIVTETRYGSQRAAQQTQIYKTGQEVLFEKYSKMLETAGKVADPRVGKIAAGVRAIGPQAKAGEIVYSDEKVKRTAEDISKMLLKGVGENVAGIAKLYKEAAPSIAIRRQQLTVGTGAPIKAVEELPNIIGKIGAAAKSSGQDIDTFIKLMEGIEVEGIQQLKGTGVSAFEVAKSKDVVEFKNIYDDILGAAQEHIQTISKMPATAQKAFRDYDKVISQLEGLSPIVEPGRPRRGAHQADIVKARFQTSAAFLDPKYTEEAQKQADLFDMNIDAQKGFIKDVNKRMRDLYYEIEQLGKLKGEFPETRLEALQVGEIKGISTLGVPESLAGRYRRGGVMRGAEEDITSAEGVEQLKQLQGVELTLYAGDLRKVSPFGTQFQQMGRNISNISAAREFDPDLVKGIKGLTSEFPSLRSQSEQALIKSGRVGEGGYGFNVIAELRHTAGTFEDQILVSGKLAEAITTSTKKLVQPFESGGDIVTGMKEGQVLRDTTAKMIQEVNKEIMQKLGVPEKYKGRADVALVKDVQRELSMMRGESVEVQTAKIAEVFLSNFGRKFTTRFGSKGVSVSPGGATQNLVDVLSKYGDKQVKVLTEEQRKTTGLGVAMMPKSMGELMADMIEGSAKKGTITKAVGMKAEDLSTELRASGNKFILDMFKDVDLGLVTEAEAKKNRDVFDKAAIAASSLGIDIAQGIDSIREAYTEQFKGVEGKGLVEAKPIDIRISSYGAAKRGLQTEALETITSNIAGAGAGGVTEIQDVVKYAGLLGGKGGPGEFATVSKGLGFKGAGKSREQIKSDLEKTYGTETDFAERAATLEDISKYYVDVIDEFGKQRKSLVGQKFVQIVEEPGQFEEWTGGAIATGAKGAKLNIPAYAAYTTIFGEGSEFMKEVNSRFDAQQAEGFEQIKAYLASQSEIYGKQFLDNLKTVKVEEIQPFAGQVGTEAELKGTVLDVEKYKTAFKTMLPSTKRMVTPEKGKPFEAGFEARELYIPGSIARQTFEDPSQAGKRGMNIISRNLQNIVNTGRSVEAWYQENADLLSELDKATIVRKSGPTLSRAFGKKSIQQLLQASEGFLSSEAESLDPDIFKSIQGFEGAEGIQASIIKAFSDQLETTDLTGKSQQDFAADLYDLKGFEGTKRNLLKTMLVGEGAGIVTQTSLAERSKDPEDQFKMIETITSRLGESVFDPGELQKKQGQLDESLTTYYKSLAKVITGKGGAVAKTFFTRKIPAILAKATNATVDRTEELGDFSMALRDINKSYGDILGDKGLINYAEDIDKIKSEHAKSVAGYKEIGLPVLKQHELGVPETLAKTLSLEFEKKFEVGKQGDIRKLEAPTKIKGTLASLLKYVESLEQAKTQDRDQIREYIDSELIPYIESIRFPFTGVSSVQPFRAKLLKGQAGKAEKTLMVPGVPEMDMSAFEKVYENIQDMVQSLSGRREGLRELGTEEAETGADKLTKVIDSLNMALSNALPKFISHAQKLDFDGDQIEIHSARTGKAREEIKRHFDILTKDVDSTAAVFRDVFTAGAIQPTQPEEYPLAYAMKAFEKKFGTEKGFQYLQRPFVTEELEYLPAKEKLGILATKESGSEPDIKSINKVMSDAFESAGAKFETLTKEGKADELLTQAINQTAALDENTKALIEGHLKTELLNAKLDDAVEAQIFKLGVGMETESITRLMRSYESGKGFGGGEISLYEGGKAGKIDESFVMRQRQTQVNELMRFAIQKGMDVKHAGEKTVASEMVQQLTTGEKAVDTLIQNIKSGDSYAELKDFMDANTSALKNQFGRYSTEQLKELSTLESIDFKDVGPSREAIITSLVDQLGFEGFLKDMQKQLHAQAVKGVMKLEGIGAEEAEAQVKKEGINVSQQITSVQDPLYRLRTTGAAEAAKTDLPAFTEDLEKALMSVQEDVRKGAYSELTKGFAGNITSLTKSIDTELIGKFSGAVAGIEFADPEKFTKLEEKSRELEKYELAFGLAPLSKTMEDSAKVQKGFLNSVEEGLVSETYMAGISPQEVEKTEDSYRKFRESQEILNVRVKRLAEVYKEFGTYAQSTAPLAFTQQKEFVSKYKRAPQTRTEKYKEIAAESIVSAGGAPPSGRRPVAAGLAAPTGEAIPVFLTGIDQGIIFPASIVASYIKGGGISTGEGLDVNVKELKDMAAKLTGGANELAGATYETMFRASAFGGGGKFEMGKGYQGPKSEDQIETIIKTMTGKKEEGKELESASLLGTALHEIIEQKMATLGNAIIEKFVTLETAEAGTITGHIDAIITEAGKQKAVDIKTIGEGPLFQLKKGIRAAGGATEYEKVEPELKNYAKYKIEEVRSQLNFYMKALQQMGEEVTEAEVHFYERFGKGEDEPVKIKFKFDEQLFQRDLAAIKTAREKISKEGKEFAKTGSLEELMAAEGKGGLSPQDFTKFYKGSEAYAKSVFKPGIKPASMFKTAGMDIDRAKAGEEFEAPIIKPYEGKGLESTFKNIKLLRQRSKLYLEQALGTDLKEDFEKLPTELQDLISTISTEGNRHVKVFMEAIEELKADPSAKFEGRQITEAWRLYKDALTGYLINNAERALEQYKQAEETGDFNEIAVAHEAFQNKVERLQDRIKADVGKASEIFTQQKQWVFPELAKSAGVFMSPLEIQRKSAKELESDPELQRVFEKITQDLSGEGVQKAPISKAREAIRELTQMNPDLIKLMENGRLLERLGPDIAEAWDFEGSVEKLSRLRNALELFKKYKVSDIPLSAEKKNLELVIKLLKDAENRLAGLDIASATQPGGTRQWGETGALPVPKWLDPKTQQAMHARNISKIREYLKRPEETGGAKIGEDITYTEKIMDQAGTTVKNVRHLFTKYAESADSAGESIGTFSHRQQDLNDAMVKGGKGLKSAVKRAAAWGLASSIVYGGVSRLQEAVGTLAEIETNVAQLRMVMSQLDTDFTGMTKKALMFAKDYGVPVTDVLKSMKVFAQQGLKQSEVLDRTRVSTLAANVSTLDSVAATEALTAAMKIFTNEGDSAMRFLDAWSEVESKHAITAGDMAEAIKKSAAAAKTAGFTFDELNGVVAAIGSVTRQTGKEVGTSLRFIMRRLTTEKGPIQLAKLDIPTLTGTGELRKGFDILGDLAMAWEDLNSAQRLAVAQAIGGTRQYNSLLVLMDNWDGALQAVEDSTNSKGSAERKNLELMKTYAKQVEQTRAAMVELQMSVGKVAFPLFKTGLKGMKVFAEALTNIPDSLKAASAGALLFVTYLTKGAKITEMISDFFRGGLVFGGVGKALKEELEIGAFEAFGLGKSPVRGSETEGLKTITAGVKAGSDLGKGLQDFESSIGKGMYLLVNAGRQFNDYMASSVEAGGKVGEVAGKGLQLGGEALGTLSTFIPKQIPLAGTIADVAGMGAAAGGELIERMSEKLGSAGGAMFKDWAQSNTGVVASIAPMLLTLDMLAPHLKKAGSEFMKTTRSSQDFETSMYQVRRQNDSVLSSIRSMSSSYTRLGRDLEKVKKLSEPGVKERRQELGTYRSPLLEMVDVQQGAIKLTNELAQSNLGLIAGYDKLGNAVLNSTSNFKSLLSTLQKSQLKEMAKTEVAVAARHIEDLTKTGGSEKWKNELKSLTKEIPVFGKLISDQIKISPVKAMETTVAQLNRLVTAKAKSPLATVYDEDIKSLQGALVKLKTQFDSTYQDFKRVISDIPLEGLSRDDVSKILGSDELRKGYELMLEVEPRLQLVGIKGVADWKDVLGAEVMKRVFPKKGAAIDVTKVLTTAKLETAGIGQRQGKVLSGDLVTFMDEAAKEFDMAGNQAIVQLKETTDGVFEWTASYFNKKTLKIEERAFGEDMQAMVESIFPQNKIQEDLSDRIEALNTFIAGAGAGLRGISPKDFKRDVSLGERFFSDIDTSTLIQGTQGFVPGAGFGESPFQKEWSEDFNRYYAKPMEEYSMLLERLQKLKLTGLSAENVNMSTGLYETIVKLQNILKNNQVVMQYRAVFADLTKTMEANTRATKENVAVEMSRLELTKETAGLLKGKAAGLAQIDLGVTKRKDLTAQQRLLIESPEFEKTSKIIKDLETKRSGEAEGVFAADKALVALASIRDVSKGFGAALSPEDLKKYTDTIVKTGDVGTAELKIETSKVVDNTAATVDRLDKLLENFQDQGSVDDLMSSWTDAISSFGIPQITKAGRTKEALGRVAGIREESIKGGDQETLIKANKALDLLSKSLVQQVGLTKATKLTKGEFSKEELVQRAFGGLGFKALEKEMTTFIPEGKRKEKFDDSVSNIYTTQGENLEKSAEKSLLNSKNIAGAAAALTTYEAFNTKYISEKVKEIDDKITKLESQITVSPAGEAVVGEQDVSIKKRIDELKELRMEEEKRAKFHGTVKAAAGAGTGAMMFARGMGLTEKNIKRLGAGGAGLGILGAAKMQTGITGEDMPEYFKEYYKNAKTFASKMAKPKEGLLDLPARWKATKDFASQSEAFMKLFTAATLGLEEHTEAIKKDTAAAEESSTKKEGESTAGMFRGGFVRGFANGGVVNGKSGKIKGPGTGTSDSIRMNNVPEGSFIIPAKHSAQAEAYLKTVKGNGAGVNIGVSNGEYYISPDDAKLLGGKTLEGLRTGKIKKFANGGSVGPVPAGTSGDTFKVSIDEPSLNKLAQITASVTAATLTRYATEKSSDKVRIAELDSLAKKESSAIYDLIMANPEAADKVLQELKQQREEKKKAPTAVETEEVPLVLNPELEFTKTLISVNALRNISKNTFDEITKEIEEVKQKALELTLAEQLEMEIEAMENAIRSANLKEAILGDLKTGRGLFTGRAEPTSVDLGKNSVLELDTQELIQLSSQRRKESRGPIEGLVKSAISGIRDVLVKYTPAERFGATTSDKFGRFKELETERQSTIRNIETAVERAMEHQIEAEAGTPGAKEALEAWNDVLEENKDKLETITEKQQGYVESISKQILEMDLLQNSLNMVTDVVANLSVEAHKSQRDISNLGMGGALRGAVTGVQLPPQTVSELTPEQYAWTQASDTMKENLENYKTTVTVYDGIMDEVSSLITKKSQLETTIATSPSSFFGKSDQLKMAERDLNTVEGELAKFNKRLDELGMTIEEASQSIYQFNKISSIMQNLEASIQRVKSVDLSESLGLHKLQGSMERLYGGGSKSAPQFVDITQRREAAEVGINLVHGIANQWDIMESELKRTISTTSDTTQRFQATQKLYDVPFLKQDEMQRREFLRQTELLKRSVSPLEEAGTALSDFAVKGELTEDQRRKVEALASQAYTSATGVIEGRDPKAAAPAYEKLEAGLRDIMPNKKLDDLINITQGAQSPIIKELQDHTTLLTIIAEESGRSIDDIRKSLGVEKDRTGLEWVKTIGSVFKKIASFGTMTNVKYAGGGKIKGPGTGTSDDIPLSTRPGSYIIQSKYADKASQYLSGFPNGSVGGKDVPILVSNGEYVMSPEQVAAVGGKGVAGMLNKGHLPKFANGGFFGSLAGGAEKLAKHFEEKRLAALSDERLTGVGGFLLKNIVGAGGAALEMGTRIGKSPLDMLAMIESISGYQAEKGTTATLGKGSDIAKSVFSKEGMKSIWSSIKEDFSKGGVGISSGLISGALGGTGLGVGKGLLSKATTGTAGEIAKAAEFAGLVGTEVGKGATGLGKGIISKMLPEKKAYKPVMSSAEIVKGMKQPGITSEEMISSLSGLDITTASFRKTKELMSKGVKAPVLNKKLADEVIKARLGERFGRLGPEFEESKSLFSALDELTKHKITPTEKPKGIFGTIKKYLGEETGAITPFGRKKGTAKSLEEARAMMQSSRQTTEATSAARREAETVRMMTKPVEAPKKKPSTDMGPEELKAFMKAKGVKGFQRGGNVTKPKNYYSFLEDIDPDLEKTVVRSKVRTDIEGINVKILQEELAKLTNKVPTSLEESEARDVKLKELTSRLDVAKQSYFVRSHSDLGAKGAEAIFKPDITGKIDTTGKLLADGRYPNIGTRPHTKSQIATSAGLVDVSKVTKPTTGLQASVKWLDYIEKNIESGSLAKDISAYMNLFKVYDTSTASHFLPKGYSVGKFNEESRTVGKAEIWDMDNPEQQVKAISELVTQARGALSQVSKGRRTEADKEYLAIFDNLIRGTGTGLNIEELTRVATIGSRLTKDKRSSSILESGFGREIDAGVHKFASEQEAELFLTRSGRDPKDLGKIMSQGVLNEEYRLFGDPLFFTAEAKIMQERQHGIYDRINAIRKAAGEDPKDLGLLRFDKQALEKIKKGQEFDLTQIPFGGISKEDKKDKSFFDYFKEIFGFSKNTEMHTGGLINSTGNYKLEKDEVVLPKRFQKGGGVDALVDTMKASNGTSGSLTVDSKKFEESVEKLADISEKLKIQDVDKLKDIKIEGIDDLKDIQIEGADTLPTEIAIVGAENLPTEIAIVGAENLKDINIIGIEELRDVTVNVQGAVGAENADELARALENINTQILSIQDTSTEEIKIINDKVDIGLVSIPNLVDKQISDNATMYREINEVNSNISNMESSLHRLNLNYGTKFEEIDITLRSVLTHLHSKG